MLDPSVHMERWPYEDDIWNINFYAANGSFAATQKFYIHPEDLKKFAENLSDFPRSLDDAPQLDVGIFTNNTPYPPLLRAYIYDSVGRAALGVSANNHADGHLHAQSSFQILCDVASLNRLGAKITEWISNPDVPLIWTFTPE